MRKPLLLFAMLLCPLFMFAQQQLVWHDEFDSTTLNPLFWTYEIGDGCANGNCGWGNAELEWYTNSTNNVRIANGNLIIEARRENSNGKPFTSGRIKTAGKVSFKYGTLEARIKVPQVSNGLWPAFWLLGLTGGDWPHNGETDILEMGSAAAIAAGKANRNVSATLHWWTDNPGGYTGAASYGRDTTAGVDLNNDYHLYKLVWDTQFITVYLDNSPFYKIDLTGGNGLNAFQNPFYIILNLAVGGNFPGIGSDANITAPLPGDMMIDYIRLYQDPTLGQQVYLGTNDAPTGNFGIFTDNTPVSSRVTIGQNDVNLFYWNNITNIPNATPYEGSNVWAVRAAAGNWFGLGVANDPINLSNYAASGSLKFELKTTSTAPFKVGISTGNGEGWVNFPGSGSEHGLVRDGQWHQVTIPVSEFGAVDLWTVNQLFMFSGDAPAATSDFYIDDVYYTGGTTNNPAPTVAITNLANDTLFTTPASIPINTNATDPNGSIAKVDFYSGDKLIGTKTTSPFNFTWTTSTQGIYTITAKATDNQGKLTTSVPVRVFVAAANNTAPQISITSPTATTSYTKPANVNITTNVTDDGQIYKVEFYNGSTLLGTVNTAPYNFTWSGVDQGTYTITAKAYDNGKKSTVSSPVTITVKDNKILADKYGIYTDDASITTHLTLGQDANLFIWNNLTTIAGAAPYEGSNVIAVTAAANNWFGLGFANDVRDLSHFASGYVKFQFKTTYQGSFRFSFIAATGQVDISFAAGEQKLGVVRDGQWHEVTIPVSSFGTLDLTQITQAFTFSGDAPAAAASFYIDNIYYTTGTTTSNVNLALNKPATVTSTENTSFTGNLAVDGNMVTRWSSAFSDPQSITVDLGADYNISEVKISWESAMGKDYLVQVSNDQSTWTQLKSVTGNSTATNDWTGLSGHGRYLQVYGTARATQWGYSILELEAYGSLHSSTLAVANNKDNSWNTSIYPNPVSGSILKVQSNLSLKQVRVVDVSGKTWLEQEVGKSSLYEININRLPAGVYLLQMMNEQGAVHLQKFIKH
jgi:beta-glucanase (GH16 family)